MPTGEIVASPARGLFTGNRGILHREDRTLGRARWTHKAWICCTLDWKGRRRQVMTGRTWTELFFLDEAVALSAGHRPCATCRRGAYDAFRDAWAAATGAPALARDMDAVLHPARTQPDRPTARLGTLPSGSFVIWRDQPHLVGTDELKAFAPDGYGATSGKQKGAEVIVLTPAPLLAVLHAGYVPALHPTAAV